MTTDTMLAVTLEQLDVHFVVAPRDKGVEATASPVALLAGLATSEEARMRLALIPLFLRRPQYAAYVTETLRHLTVAQQDLLRCYYTAAQLLQQIHHRELTALYRKSAWLPDMFEDVLNLICEESADVRLQQLADQQSELTGRQLNWYGTYQHAYTRLVRHEKQRQKWQRSASHKLKNS